MAGSGFSTLSGAVKDFAAATGAGYTEAGERAAAATFGKAATLAEQNAQEALAAGKLQQLQTARQVMQVGGAGVAASAANGLRLGGSVASLLRANATQGALAHQLLGTQTAINVNSYMEQAQADYANQAQAESAAQAAKAAKSSGIMGGIFGSGMGVAELGLAAVML